MSRSRKIWLGIFTFLPIILLAVYIALFISMFFTFFGQRIEHDPTYFFANFYPVLATGILMAISSIALLIYYLIHAINNKQLDSTERIVWILVFLFAGMIGFPIYWYMRIWTYNPPIV